MPAIVPSTQTKSKHAAGFREVWEGEIPISKHQNPKDFQIPKIQPAAQATSRPFFGLSLKKESSLADRIGTAGDAAGRALTANDNQARRSSILGGCGCQPCFPAPDLTSALGAHSTTSLFRRHVPASRSCRLQAQAFFPYLEFFGTFSSESEAGSLGALMLSSLRTASVMSFSGLFT